MRRGHQPTRCGSPYLSRNNWSRSLLEGQNSLATSCSDAPGVMLWEIITLLHSLRTFPETVGDHKTNPGTTGPNEYICHTGVAGRQKQLAGFQDDNKGDGQRPAKEDGCLRGRHRGG